MQGTSGADTIKCPRCEQIDKVEKVSATVSAGTTTSQSNSVPGLSFSTSGDLSMSLPSFGGIEQVSSTELSKRLNVKLEDELTWTGWLRVLGAVVAPIVLTWQLWRWWWSDEDPLVTKIIVAILDLFLLLVAIGLIIAASKEPEVRARNRQIQALWNTLYYCQRCDVVYVPGTPGRGVPPEQVHTLYPAA